jgi:hypothetical protein
VSQRVFHREMQLLHVIVIFGVLWTQIHGKGNNVNFVYNIVVAFTTAHVYR